MIKRPVLYMKCLIKKQKCNKAVEFESYWSEFVALANFFTQYLTLVLVLVPNPGSVDVFFHGQQVNVCLQIIIAFFFFPRSKST